MIDPVDSLPEAEILRRSSGSLAYIGRSFADREIWLDRGDMTRHMFVSGSTGSGRTEFLLSLCANAVAAGSGLIFIDGKGDVSTFAKVNAIAARFGRLEDVVLLNLSAARSDRKASTHTLNPFREQSPDAIVQMITGLMGPLPSGDNAMWHNRAVALVSAAVGLACWRRSSAGEEVTPTRLRECLALDRLFSCSAEARRTDIPDAVLRPITCYLNTLPGFQWPKGKHQSQTTLDQHGYLVMQTTKLFSQLADAFGHVFDAGTSEIDMRDVVLNRRILVVLLPTLSNSSTEVANLGRLVVGLLKNMMAEAMAAPVEGTWESVVEDRPTSAAYPFLAIMDEAAYYVTDGMGAMAGQARSLGFWLVFAVQDVAAFLDHGKKEAKDILANTNTKIFMASDRADTSELRALLPSSPPWEGRGQLELLDAQIWRLKTRLQDGFLTASKRATIQAALEELHDQKVAFVTETREWNLHKSLNALKPGEFILVRSGAFLRGRALHVTPGLVRTSIHLNRFVGWSPSVEAIQLQYDRPARLAALRETISSLSSERPFSLASHYAKRPFGGAKASVRLAFAACVVGTDRPNDDVRMGF